MLLGLALTPSKNFVKTSMYEADVILAPGASFKTRDFICDAKTCRDIMARSGVYEQRDYNISGACFL